MNRLESYIAPFIVGIVFLSCNNFNDSSNELINQVPEQTQLLIKLKGDETSEDLSSHLNRLLSFEEFKNVKEQLALLNKFSSKKEGLLSFVQLEKDKLDFILIKKNKEQLPSLTASLTTSIYDNQELQLYQFGDEFIYSWSNKQLYFLSSSQLLIENSIRNYNNTAIDSELKELFKKSSQNNFFIKAQSSSWMSNKLRIGAQHPKNMASWMALEAGLSTKETKAHGLTTLNDSIEHFLYLFENQKPIELKGSHYAPYTTESLWSFGISDFERFDRQKDRYLGKKHQADSLFSSLKEFAQISFNKQKIHLFRGVYADQLFERFSTEAVEYQGVPIAKFSTAKFKKHFHPILDLSEDQFSCLIEDVLFSSSSQEALKTLISSYNTKATFDRSTAYRTMIEELASKSNVNYIGKLSLAIEQLEDKVDEVFGMQWVADKNFFHTHMSLKKFDSLPNPQQIAPLFSVKLEAPIRLGPFVVINHRTSEKELILQDQNNKLYLIDSKGSVLWNKQLNAPIREIIHQVDLYKNKRLQFAFTTDNQFIVLDRNGKEVNDYIKTFKDGNLGPLAVFDYDNSRAYRFVFSQGTSIFMLNNKGSNVKGFQFTKAEVPLIEVPKHFRLNNKDYLVFKLANGALKILNRKGNTRLKIPSHFDFSNNDIFTYQGHFAFSDKEGNLRLIDQKGNETIQDLILEPNHYLDIKEEGIASLNENHIKFRDKTYTLPFGSYAGIKLFEFNNRYYITTTDKDTNKLYVLDSELNLLDQFPVFGFSTATMADLNNDGILELISLDGPDGIIVYSGL